MIKGFIHPGSGVGNQLHRYIATRTAADNAATDFGMVGWEYFKAPFIGLDKGENVEGEFQIEHPAGKIVTDEDVWTEGTSYYNPEFNFIQEGFIDGEFQDERYFDIEKVKEWLPTEKLEMPDDKCVIGFRGGEFTIFPELFLTPDYWNEAIGMMKERHGDIFFEVHTDDPETARQFFPEFNIIHDVDLNWRSVRYAKHLIISNSSFYIFPSLMNEKADVIAPRFWARRNIQEWSMPQNYYKRFDYI